MDTINQMLNGQLPDMSHQQNQQGNQGSVAHGQVPMQGGAVNEDDIALCSDMLMTEKYVSGTYDTAVFESTDTNMRQALNHIQKEEQQHGESIFNYMESKGKYNPQ